MIDANSLSEDINAELALAISTVQFRSLVAVKRFYKGRNIQTSTNTKKKLTAIEMATRFSILVVCAVLAAAGKFRIEKFFVFKNLHHYNVLIFNFYSASSSIKHSRRSILYRTMRQLQRSRDFRRRSVRM